QSTRLIQGIGVHCKQHAPGIKPPRTGWIEYQPTYGSFGRVQRTCGITDIHVTCISRRLQGAFVKER
ncbi:MAG: hypothetical protein WCT06_05540, partial [Armatimonadota bacterium]